MRLTVHLNTFDRFDPCAYVIFRFDKESNEWSREDHVGLDLPESGKLAADTGGTLVCTSNATRRLCMLEGLDLGSCVGSGLGGGVGRARWFKGDGLAPAPGHWHVQCI